MIYQSLLIQNSFQVTPNEIYEIIKKEFNNIQIANQEFNLVFDGQTLKIEDLDYLLEWSSKKTEKGVKVLLIQNSQNLSEIIQNSLLKIIEEPTQNTLICLVTKNLDAIIETIKSRCRIVIMPTYKNNLNVDFEDFLKKSYFERSIEFQKLANLDKIEQVKFLEDLSNFAIKKINKPKILRELIFLQKAINSSVQSNLVFDNLNILIENNFKNTKI
ncbi:MAG: DNA polymerase III subunit delta' [Candidatus Dojkabacteria bacterium]|nr:MAG: DNA polymerase III subunit delta' [Candidatus Dojkabacteria bacterium]